jgi:hypothetical protein
VSVRDAVRCRQLFVQYHACEVGQLEKAGGVYGPVLLVVTLCACRCVHGRLQSVVTGDIPSNGVHVHISGPSFEYVFKTHNRCTSGMRFVMQYHPPPPFRAHSSIISNFSLRMIPAVRCVPFSATRSL